MSTLVIKGGRIIDPATKRDKVGDVFIADGKIAASLTAAQKKSAKVIDAKGLVVCPGLVDIHVHFREPGQTHKENILTGSQAAAAGGFTTVVCMPNTSPVADNAGTIELINNAARKAPIHVYPTGCITVGMKGQQLAPHGSLKKAGVVAITDDGLCVESNQLMRNAVEYAKMFDLPVLDHCQDESLTKGAVMNEGTVSTRLGLKGWPHAAEDIIVARNIILSAYSGAHIHMQHISSAMSVELVRRAKKDGINVTAEATPHHIALTEESLGTYDTNFKMNPPLRTEKDRKAIIAGLRDGALDCIGTDHAPHAPDEKDKEFDYAPNGITGLETALPVCLEQVQAPLRHRSDDPQGRQPPQAPRRHARRRRRGRRLHLRPQRDLALRRQERLQQIPQLPLVRPETDGPREDDDRLGPYRFPEWQDSLSHRQ
jgi:dihydroorotase